LEKTEKMMEISSHKPQILVTGPVPKEIIDEFGDLVNITVWKDNDHFLMPENLVLSVIGNYDAIINFAEVKIDENFIGCAKKLKIVSNVSIGYDNLNIELLTRNRIWATNTPALNSYAVAEYVLASILCLTRKLLEADYFVRTNNWISFEPGRWDGYNLKEKILGIVGMGSIGIELRKMALAIGCKVIYTDLHKKNLKGLVSYKELVQNADIISVHVPLNEGTFRLVSKEVINEMKPDAILVNTSRGTIIDQEALIEALVHGKLSGAVLDVFEDEPEVPNVLKTMYNVLLTPHMAGGTYDSRVKSIKQAFLNVTTVLKGQDPINPLNIIR
jgi:glyoxylate reductase